MAVLNRITEETDFVAATLINQKGAAEGPGLSPRQRGLERVPIVSGLRVLRTEAFLGGTKFVLVWQEPDANLTRFVSHYNVYVTGLLDGDVTPQGPAAFQHSPAIVKLDGDGVVRVTFYVQTVLTNGALSDLLNSPSVSATTSPATLTTGDIADDSITIAKIADGTAGQLLTWDAAGEATTIGPGAADSPLVGSGAGAVPQFKTRAALDLVLGNSALTTASRLVLVASAGTVTQLGSLGTTTTVLHGNAAGAPSFAAVSLTADVTGTLPVGNGGTGATSFTSGSVIFSNGTVLTQDNANFFWDDTTNFLGVGNGAPAARLHVTEATLGNEVLRLTSTATNDDPVESLFQNRAATTDATVTTLHTVAIPAATTVALEAVVVARRTGGAAGSAEDGARYKLSAVYKNVAGTATLIGAVTKVSDEDQAGWDANFTPSAGNVLVEATGALDNNVTWHLTLRYYAVSS